MRSIGIASRALELMLLRCTDDHKVAFGKQLYQHGTVVAAIAQSRMEIDQARLLVLSAALQIDLVRAKGAMKDIGMAKAVVPRVVGEIIDRAMQVHGAEGICQDSPLPALWAGIRTLRYADGPDEVHIQQSKCVTQKGGNQNLPCLDMTSNKAFATAVGLKELKEAPRLRARQVKQKQKTQDLLKAAGLKPHGSHL